MYLIDTKKVTKIAKNQRGMSNSASRGSRWPRKTFITGKGSKSVKVNVGDTCKYYTTIDTFTKQDNMLQAMFTGKMEVLIDSDGWILIDRPGQHFPLIVNFLKGFKYLPKSNEQIAELLVEAEYYCITELVDLCKEALQRNWNEESDRLKLPQVNKEIIPTQEEEKLANMMDGLTDKSSQGRTDCYKMFTKSLIKSYVPSFCKDRILTLCNCIEKSLKKGIAQEVCAAADFARVLCVQLDTEALRRNLAQGLKPILINIMCNASASLDARAKCCTALADISFLSGDAMGEILTLMQQLETIFSESYGSPSTVSPDKAYLHAAAINSWSLLFTLMDPGSLRTTMSKSKKLPSLGQLSKLLESSHLNSRLAAGEAIALLFEIGREEDDNFGEDSLSKLTETLKQLATDSNKYRAKNDRKQQKATFRDILQYIEENRASDANVTIGKDILLLDSWVKRKQYDALCDILGPGINTHLMENDLLKLIFQLECLKLEAGIPNYARWQTKKNKRKIINEAKDKKKTMARRCDRRSKDIHF